MKEFLSKLKNSEILSFEESKLAFEVIMEGKASEDEIFYFLTLLSKKGESSNEIAGGVYVLRNKSKRVNVTNAVDTCGTGGDGKNTLNISTASALLLASMGIKVAKHGNKAVSSKCGSGDVLESLNININLEPKEIEENINKNNSTLFHASKSPKSNRKQWILNHLHPSGSIILDNGAIRAIKNNKRINFLISGKFRNTWSKVITLIVNL